jgi:hypothetical protein
MTKQTARHVTVAFFTVYTVVLTYPGVLPFNRIRPFIFGLPFSFFWVSVWVTGAFAVFLFLEWGTRKTGSHREAEPPEEI